MENNQQTASDHLAEARWHIMALRNSTGMTEEEVFRWISGKFEPTSISQLQVQPPQYQPQSQPQQPQSQQHFAPPQAQQQAPATPVSPISSSQAPYLCDHRPRLSISSTQSTSTGQQSIFSGNSRTSSSESTVTRYELHQHQHQHQHHQQLPQQGPMPPNNQPQQNQSVVQGSPTTPIQQEPQLQPSFSASEKIYKCTSCDTGFKRKFDWKRHEEEFHERFKKYPCPDCNRTLWGSNSFKQHHKIAHGCRTCPHADEVVKYTRKRMAWSCGFCAAFLPTRDRYFDHVAKHFDQERKTKAEWLHSNVIYGLLHQRTIHDAWKAQTLQRERDYPGRIEKLSWDPTRTGRAQGFMEGECPGQLQDLLEFFCGAKREAKNICRLAYEQADILYLPRSLPLPGACLVPSEAKPTVPADCRDAANVAPQVVVTAPQWAGQCPPVDSRLQFSVQGPAVPDPTRYRYSVLDRALPRVPQDTPLAVGVPPHQPSPTSQPQVQQDQSQAQPEPVPFTAEVNSTHVMFDSPMMDASITDWESFSTTVVDDGVNMREPPAVEFNPQEYFSDSRDWSSDLQS